MPAARDAGVTEENGSLPADIVADEAEARCSRLFLHGPSQRGLKWIQNKMQTTKIEYGWKNEQR